MVLAEDLRQAVLQAALQGKLTEQFETDSDVDDLLKKIKKRKEILIVAKEIKKSKTDLSVDEDDFLFQIPSNWRWVKLGSIATVKGGKRVPVGETLVEIDTGHKYIRVADMKNGTVDESDIKYITDEVYSVIKNYFITKNDIYITVAGTIGRVGSIPDALDMANLTENADKIIFEYLNKEWFIDVLNSKTLQWQIVQATKKVGQPKLALNKIETLLIPLPPIEEQQRIVDKINEIMPKIDEYEKIEKELEALKKEFPNNMKDALLQAAMQGKLTEQLESDSSVDELLVVIQREKEELIAQKKIKKEKPLSDIEEEEIPFDIPENWRWVRLGNVGTLTRGSGIKRNEVAETGFPCVRYGELYTTYKTKFDVAVSHTSKELFDKSQKVNRNDILMALTGENNFDIALALAYVGDETVAMGGDLTRWSNHHMNPLYLVYAMNSSYAIHKKSEMAKGDIIVHISNDKLSTILLPIPPIEEQNRIVEKLDTLLPLCEALKEE